MLQGAATVYPAVIVRHLNPVCVNDWVERIGLGVTVGPLKIRRGQLIHRIYGHVRLKPYALRNGTAAISTHG